MRVCAKSASRATLANTPALARVLVQTVRPARQTWIATRQHRASHAQLATTWLRSPQAHARHAQRVRRMTTTTLGRLACSVPAGATLQRARRVARLALPANTTTTRAMRTAHPLRVRAVQLVSTLQRARRHAPRASLDGRMRTTTLRLSVLLARRASTLPWARRAAATAQRGSTTTTRRLAARLCR